VLFGAQAHRSPWPEPSARRSGGTLGVVGVARSTDRGSNESTGPHTEYVTLGFVFVADELEPQELAALIARARTGDSQAFAAIYDAYAGRLYRFLALRVTEPADAEDLLQRVFVKVVEALPRYQDRGLPFGAWLFRIARNVAIDFARARPDEEALTVAGDRADGAAQPARIAEQQADRRIVREALDLLTQEQRDVLVYRFFAGLNPREIAALMGKREGSVRALQFRALATLRRHLEPTFLTDIQFAEIGA
jgi:RNA polymerase sigma-70 factor, ECF subfamily